jgi:hypothetical protein
MVARVASTATSSTPPQADNKTATIVCVCAAFIADADVETVAHQAVMALDAPLADLAEILTKNTANPASLF